MAEPRVTVKMLACRTNRDYRYLTGEVRTIPLSLAEQFIKERAARQWPPPAAQAPTEDEKPLLLDGQQDDEADDDEPEQPQVRIGDRVPDSDEAE